MTLTHAAHGDVRGKLKKKRIENGKKNLLCQWNASTVNDV